MTNYRRLAEESLSRSQFIHSPSWPSVSLRTPAQPRWRSGLVGMASVSVWRSGLTSTVQPIDKNIHATYLEGMGTGLFNTSGTKHGTSQYTAEALPKPEGTVRRGGGEQINKERHVEGVPEDYKKNMARKKPKNWRCVGCNARLGEGTQKHCSNSACKRICCNDCLVGSPGAQSGRRICPKCAGVNN